MNKQYAIAFLSVVPLRANASHASEMVSQVLFGETMQILEQEDHWLRVRTSFDDYEGWIDEKQVKFLDDNLIEKLNQHTQFITLDVNTLALKGAHKEPVYLCAGSILPFFEEGKCTLDDEHYQIISSNVMMPNADDFASDVEEIAKRFLNVPYLWGGRTHFGIDCSGFTQTVFRMLGKKIRRDASQQAEQGTLVNFLTEAKAGDLAFFDNEEGRITHVGIMLNNSQIIHASGRVKIDFIDNQGIFSSDLKKYSHKLRIIKRYQN
jgi:cell wall-associated NlpC family hydrolase